MLSVFWKYEGVLHYEFILEDPFINSELYLEQLQRMYYVLVNWKRVLFQQDNVKPLTSHYRKEKLEDKRDSRWQSI